MKRLCLLLIPILFGALACSDTASFTIGTFEEALAEAGGTGDIVDSNNDGLPDGIDTNGDGIPEVPFVPPEVTDENGDPVPPDQIEDPENPILRDDSDHCIAILGSTVSIDGADDLTITAADVGSAEVLAVTISSTDKHMSIDLAGSSVKRILAFHHGNGNRITVSNTEMTQGYCNQMSGNSNEELLEATSSAVVVDLMSGNGGSNKLDIRFTPSTGLRYQMSGNNQCISAPADSVILSHSANNDSHDELFDGTTCL